MVSWCTQEHVVQHTSSYSRTNTRLCIPGSPQNSNSQVLVDNWKEDRGATRKKFTPASEWPRVWSAEWLREPGAHVQSELNRVWKPKRRRRRWVGRTLLHAQADCFFSQAWHLRLQVSSDCLWGVLATVLALWERLHSTRWYSHTTITYPRSREDLLLAIHSPCSTTSSLPVLPSNRWLCTVCSSKAEAQMSLPPSSPIPPTPLYPHHSLYPHKSEIWEYFVTEVPCFVMSRIDPPFNPFFG